MQHPSGITLINKVGQYSIFQTANNFVLRDLFGNILHEGSYSECYTDALTYHEGR
jgi:hypothetical protein